MTRAQAEQLVREKEGKLCTRFYRRADGTILTADCPVGVRKLRFRRMVYAAVGVGILTLGAFLAAAAVGTTTMGEIPTMGAIHEVQGDISVPSQGQVVEQP